MSYRKATPVRDLDPSTTHPDRDAGTEEPHLLFDVQDGIAHMVMNRPAKHNAMSPEMIVRMAGAWATIAADPAIRVAVLSGRGGRAFTSGADLRRLVPLLSGERQPEDEWDERLRANRRLVSEAFLRGAPLMTPVIAAVQGFALGGGTELLLAADIRVAAEDSTFGLTEVTRGLIPGGGGLARLGRQIPWAAAAEIVLVGDAVAAPDALRMGLVNRVVPAQEVDAVADRLARRMAANGPLAMRKAKEVMVRGTGTSLAEAFRIENECAKGVLASEDAREGPRAFRERRTPVFVGR